jgi:hypothetical protein
VNKEKVADNIEAACSACGEMSLLDTKLEDCNPVALDVRVGLLDDHVSMQPAAIAYFGSLLKDASRTLVNLKHGYDRWQKLKYAAAKSALSSGGGKATVADIEAKVVADNEPDIVAWEQKIQDAERVRDELEVWYEAWRQKSYSMSQHADLVGDELRTQSHMGHTAAYAVAGKEESDFRSSKDRVRAIMGKKSS